MAGQIELVVTEEFKEAFSKLPGDIKKKIRKQLRFLQANPAHPSLKIHKLNGEWEFYVDIHYRCFFLSPISPIFAVISCIVVGIDYHLKNINKS